MKLRLFFLVTIIILLASAVLCVCLLRRVEALEAANTVITFVLDPGHGGEDGGAVSADGLRESEINLAIGRRTDALLGLFGIDCVLTRSEEELDYPSGADTVRKRKQADLERRVKLVASTEDAVLVSIHQNKYPSVSPHGAQVFYNEYPGSREFALYTQSVLTGVLGDSVRPAVPIADSIYLMRKAACPAILVECGFLSNPTELELLRSPAYQTRLALALAAACIGYTTELEQQYGKG